jgi:hypothetical protein
MLVINEYRPTLGLLGAKLFELTAGNFVPEIVLF